MSVVVGVMFFCGSGTAKDSQHAQRQRMRRDNSTKQYQGRDPDQAEQNDNAKSKRTKNCISHVWLFVWCLGLFCAHGLG